MSLKDKLDKSKKTARATTSKLKKRLGVQTFQDTVEYDGTLEGDTQAETEAVLKGFKERAKAETERFEQATDTRFYFTVVFQTEAQKLRFLQAMGWLGMGDAFLDGLQIAKHQGVALDKVKLRNRDTVTTVDRKLEPLVMTEADTEAV